MSTLCSSSCVSYIRGMFGPFDYAGGPPKIRKKFWWQGLARKKFWLTATLWKKILSDRYPLEKKFDWQHVTEDILEWLKIPSKSAMQNTMHEKLYYMFLVFYVCFLSFRRSLYNAEMLFEMLFLSNRFYQCQDPGWLQSETWTKQHCMCMVHFAVHWTSVIRQNSAHASWFLMIQNHSSHWLNYFWIL